MERNTHSNTSDIAAATFGNAVDRRSLIRGIAGIGAAAAVAATLGVRGAGAALTQYKTTARVNLRSGASTSASVITVVPAGAIVSYQGVDSNAFVNVGYGHFYGWIHQSYLVAVGDAPKPIIVGTARTTASVNLRNGPSTGNQVVRVVPKGAAVQISDTVRQGFRYVVYNGQGGWMTVQFLSIDGGQPGEAVFYATANLNLRAEPNTSAKVLLVVPSGAKVTALAGTANGWRQVSYKGTAGWAATSYLN